MSSVLSSFGNVSGSNTKPPSQAFFKAPQNVDSIAFLQNSGEVHSESDECLAATSVSQNIIIGTYVLESDADSQGADSTPSIRKGSALLMQATRRQMKESPCSYHLSKLDEIALPAVLDVQSSTSTRTAYAACAQNGLFALSCTTKADQLCSKVIRSRGDDLETMLLSLDVHDYGVDRLIATSDSKGIIGLHRLSENGDAEEVFERDGHSLEAWNVCISRSLPCSSEKTVVYSGGDDGILCAWRGDTKESIFRRRNAHGGVGVTTVATRQGQEHELWSGGYDDTIRIWDLRSSRRCVEELNVGGGVWRVKFHPRDQDCILVAAMYDGFKALNLIAGSHLQMIARFEAHKSIAYGASWLPSLDSKDELVAITGSFYDQAVHLWSIKVSKGDPLC
ncbi:unnamed protein product [Agarophyton chilense]|eukprot:gb/GEZJ01004233.1/.p2 GENE.gb/GEZJ01004233.1/~~gb/GEZJ01004233.1/.p2  ORF type:complete len:393 (+),score=43.62 gb/GEZJ01004233.1/:1413-2591(+)